jgi:predicted outer membrane protein
MTPAMPIASSVTSPRRLVRSRAKHTPEERAAISRAHLARARQVQAAKKAERRLAPVVCAEPEVLTPARQLYRDEKAAKAARDALFMAGVRAELDAAMAAQTEQRKKGPRFGGRIEVRRDPVDALIVALEGGR